MLVFVIMVEFVLEGWGREGCVLFGIVGCFGLGAIEIEMWGVSCHGGRDGCHTF